MKLKSIALLLATAMLSSVVPVYAKDPIDKKEPWERDRFRLLVYDAMNEGNWELIRDWAEMDMHDVVMGTDKIRLTINENNITPAHRALLGMQDECGDNYTMYFQNGGKFKQTYIDACERMPDVPVFRWGGTSSNYVNYANNLDTYNKRKGSEVISLPDGGGSDGGGTIGTKGAGAYQLGMGEQLQKMYLNNPEAELIPVISILTTSAEDVKKVVHFLLDEEDESEWGKMRSELYGIKEPVKVPYWEISNELDQHNEVGREWHAKRAREIMTAILEEEPDARCLVCGPSAPWLTGAPGNKETKIEDWVHYITEQCGDLMYGMSWHPYYDGYGTAYMLWLSDTMDKYMKETSEKMGFKDKDGNPKVFKIIGTEGARYDSPADRNYPGSANYESALSTAHFLNVMQQRDYYEGNMLHTFVSATPTMWPYLTYIDGEFFLSPTVKMYEVYDEAMGDYSMETEWYIQNEDGTETGFEETCYTDWNFSAAAYATGEDEITVLLLNKSNYREKDVEIQFQYGGYELTGITTLEAPNLNTWTWDMESENLTTIKREEMKEMDKYNFHMRNGTIQVLHYRDTAKRGIGLGKTPSDGGDDTSEVFEEIETGFTDIDYSWAKGEISKMQSLGFVSGKTPNTYAPRDLATNAEFAVMLSNALKLDTSFKGQIFSDVPKGVWYEKYANACYVNGVLLGSTFDAEESITLRELIKAANQICDVYKNPINTDTGAIIAANGLSLWGEDAEMTAKAIERNLIYRLYENGHIELDRPVTREELTSVIYRLYTYIGA